MVPPEPPSPTPIPVEGDVQIFANQECTQYATGNEETVYARINVPWGYNGGWEIQYTGDENSIYCIAPSNDVPNDPYKIGVWVDWESRNFDRPFNPGEVVAVTVRDAVITVQNPTVIFTKP